ncbi:MAG: hypothetical protein KAI83_13055 [Thiomargarita sp.]|nr:hypothetical protein [Thiomargarita sp.]
MESNALGVLESNASALGVLESNASVSDFSNGDWVGLGYIKSPFFPQPVMLTLKLSVNKHNPIKITLK